MLSMVPVRGLFKQLKNEANGYILKDGKSNRFICEKPLLTERTVKNYVAGILEKLELKNRTELVIYIKKMSGLDQNKL